MCGGLRLPFFGDEFDETVCKRCLGCANTAENPMPFNLLKSKWMLPRQEKVHETEARGPRDLLLRIENPYLCHQGLDDKTSGNSGSSGKMISEKGASSIKGKHAFMDLFHVKLLLPVFRGEKPMLPRCPLRCSLGKAPSQGVESWR